VRRPERPAGRGGRGRRRPAAALGLALAVLAAACARPAPPAGAPGPPAGRLVLPPGGDVQAQARLVAARARDRDVVYLGEAHDNPHHHAGQAAVVRALVAAGTRPAVAFEMIPEGDQEDLEGAVRDGTGRDEVGRRLRWRERGWPDFALYWPVFEAVRQGALPVVATDLAPATVRLISRGGLEAAGADAARLASRLPPDPSREAAIARTIRTAHCDALPESRIPRMVESWHARNVTIARRLAAAVDGRTGAPVAVIIGAGHQAAGGVPDQLAALRPGTRQLVVEFREAGPAPDSAPGAEAGDDRADVVWLTPGLEREDPCAAFRRSRPTA
jgi:uncharacterized iron-regulated protein